MTATVPDLHPGLVAYSFDELPAVRRFEAVRQFASTYPLQPILRPIPGRTTLATGARLSGAGTVATATRIGGLVAASAGSTEATWITLSTATATKRANGLRIAGSRAAYEQSFADPRNVVSVTVPTAALAVDVSALDLDNCLDVDVPPVAWNSLTSVARTLLSNDAPDWVAKSPTAIDRYLVGLIDLALAAILDTADRDVDPAASWLRTQAEGLIDAHFVEAGLTPARIADKLGVSLRSLYRAFDDGTGVATRLRKQRLQHARLLLADPNLRRVPIDEIARRSGFTSVPTFRRTFAAEYGIAPNQFRLYGPPRN